MKDLRGWCDLKIKIESEKSENSHVVSEGDIWWCYLGSNIGDEQDGVGESYSRPVLVVRKFNRKVCIVVPMSTKLKSGVFYFCTDFKGVRYSILLSQIRLISIKRFMRRIRCLPKEEFNRVKSSIIKLIFE